MRNISEHSKQIFSKLSGDSQCHLGLTCKNSRKSWVPIFREGVGKFFLNPPYLPQFWIQGAENSSAFRHIGALPSFWISRHNPKNRAWGDDRRNKKFQLFGRVSILHQNPLEGVKGTLNLRTAFYIGIKRKSCGQWGFLNFVPKIEFGDLKFGEQKLFYSLFLPQFWTRGAKSFWVLKRFRRHTFVFNFKTLTLKTGHGKKLKKSHFSTKGGTSNQVISEDITDRQILQMEYR